MKKVIVIVVISLCGLLLFVQSQEQLTVGKKLNILLNEVVTDHQIIIENFIFERKLLMEESPEGQLSILEEKANELMGTVENLNAQKTELVQNLQDGNIAREEFAVEMQKLTAEMAAVTRSMSILREKISALTGEVPEDLYNRALTLIDTFSQMTHILSLMETSITEEMRKQGHEPPPMPEIPEPPPESPPPESPPPSGSPPPSESPPPGSPPPSESPPPSGSPPPSDSPPPPP